MPRRMNPTPIIKGRFTPTHRHYKGGLYQFLFIGMLEAELAIAAIYRDADGHIWVRDHEQFMESVVVDGEEVPRFAPLEKTDSLTEMP